MRSVMKTATLMLRWRTRCFRAVGGGHTHRAFSSYPHRGQFWCREDTSNNNTLLLGVKEQWIEEMVQGDVDSIVASTSSDALEIEYSGLSYSEADELYHSVWSNTEGTVQLSVDSLLPGNVEMVGEPEINQALLKRPFMIHESTWIFKVKTK